MLMHPPIPVIILMNSPTKGKEVLFHISRAEAKKGSRCYDCLSVQSRVSIERGGELGDTHFGVGLPNMGLV